MCCHIDEPSDTFQDRAVLLTSVANSTGVANLRMHLFSLLSTVNQDGYREENIIVRKAVLLLYCNNSKYLRQLPQLSFFDIQGIVVPSVHPY